MLFLPFTLAIIMPFEHVQSLHIQEPLRRQLIAAGRPYDFDDVYRDTAAKKMREVAHKKRLGHRRHEYIANNTHFFTKADCSIFVSPHRCAEARHHVTYLDTYPCSGNTWTRSVFEETLLIYTGSVFCDRTLHRIGFLGECNRKAQMVFPVKTHWPTIGPHRNGNGVKTFVIIREPLHAALSWISLTFTERKGHNAEVPKKKLQMLFNKHVRDRLTKWAYSAQTFKDRNDLVVRYEDLVDNTAHVYLKIIFPYLGVKSDNPEIIARLNSAISVSDEAYNTTRRKHSYVFEFSDNHTELAKEIVGKDLAKHFGYKL